MIVQMIFKKFPHETLINVAGEAKDVEKIVDELKKYAVKHELEVK